eukprot:6068414-Lingulodinium_polyedra.AAC.1
MRQRALRLWARQPPHRWARLRCSPAARAARAARLGRGPGRNSGASSQLSGPRCGHRPFWPEHHAWTRASRAWRR